jgi:hypothetical protein
MTSQQSYYEIAADLANTAPQQARLLKHLLMQSEMETMPQICDTLRLSPSGFRDAVANLRDRGVEVVCKRELGEESVYRYGVVTAEVEGWSGDRRKAVLTAWGRTTKVFERHLFALDLPHSEVYKILGVMEYVTKTLQDIDLDVSLKTEAAAAAEAERVQEVGVPA